MAEYVRIARFSADEAALDALVSEIGSHDTGTMALDAMTPPADANMTSTSVEAWEIVLERNAP